LTLPTARCGEAGSVDKKNEYRSFFN